MNPTNDQCYAKESIEQFRATLATRRYTPRSATLYCGWVRRYLRFHQPKQPSSLGRAQVRQFCKHLTETLQLGPSSCNQALSALLLFHKLVLLQPEELWKTFARAPRSGSAPTVLTANEVAAILDQLSQVPKLIVSVLYCTGLRLLEATRLRVADVNMEERLIRVAAPRYRARLCSFPQHLTSELTTQLVRAQKLFSAAVSWELCWLFPGRPERLRAAAGEVRYHPVHASVIQRAVSAAGARAGVRKRVHCHAFRHSYAARLFEAGHPLPVIQGLLGHRDLASTRLYGRALGRLRQPSGAEPFLL